MAPIRTGVMVLVFLAGFSAWRSASAEYLVPEAGLRFPDQLGPLTLWKSAKYYGTLAELEMALLAGAVTYHTAICFWYTPPREAEDNRPKVELAG